MQPIEIEEAKAAHIAASGKDAEVKLEEDDEESGAEEDLRRRNKNKQNGTDQEKDKDGMEYMFHTLTLILTINSNGAQPLSSP